MSKGGAVSYRDTRLAVSCDEMQCLRIVHGRPLGHRIALQAALASDILWGDCYYRARITYVGNKGGGTRLAQANKVGEHVHTPQAVRS